MVICLTSSACSGAGTDLNALVNASGGPSDAGAFPLDTGPEGPGYTDPFAGAPPYSMMPAWFTFLGTDPQHFNESGYNCTGGGGDCHGPGGDGQQAFIGGTIYSDYYAKVPLVGAEIRVVDSSGHSASTYSGLQGAFILTTSQAAGLAFPVLVGARTATSSRPMIRTVTSSMASCDQSACHVPGGNPTTGSSYYPIHVP